MLISGQRFYFFEQKRDLQAEIERLNLLYKKNYYKKKEYKKNITELQDKFNKTINRYDAEINNYKNRVLKSNLFLAKYRFN